MLNENAYANDMTTFKGKYDQNSLRNKQTTVLKQNVWRKNLIQDLMQSCLKRLPQGHRGHWYIHM